jgi:hypothetical protein
MQVCCYQHAVTATCAAYFVGQVVFQVGYSIHHVQVDHVPSNFSAVKRRS